jgi:hypothetical protein
MLIPSLTPQAVADGVQRILANPAKYQAMRLAGLDAPRVQLGAPSAAVAKAG